MAFNPNITEETGLFPIIANGAYTNGRAMVASTPDSSNNQRGAQAVAVGQNADLSLVPRFLGVGSLDIATTKIGSIQRKGRVRAQGGGAIVAPALVTFDANAKFVAYAHDATKFGMVCGIAATDCSGDNAYFDLVLEPMVVGPASAAADNFTLSGTLTAADVVATDDITAGGRIQGAQGIDVASANDLVLGGDGNTFEITGNTQINHIANTGWQNGSEVTLLFTSTPTVDHANASAGANITILLDGAVDFVAAAGDRLKLLLCEIGGTQAWREVGRVTVA